MKLGLKLGISTGTLIVAMFLSAFTAQVRGGQARQMSSHISEGRMPLVLALHNLRGHTRNSLLELQYALIFGSEARGERGFNPGNSHTAQDLSADIVLFRQNQIRSNTGLDLAQLDTLLLELEDLQGKEQAIHALMAKNTPEASTEARMALGEAVLPLLDSIYRKSATLINTEEAFEAQDFTNLQHANDSVVWTIWLVTLLGAALGAVISVTIAHRVTSTICLLADRAKAIAAGDLTGSALDVQSRDEIHDLAEAMQQMQTSLGGIIGTVADTAGSLTGSAASMRSASDQIHRRIDQQSQQTQQAATAMQEMSASIAEVSRHTQSAAETARSAAQTARDGGTIVKEMLSSMHLIATAVTDTSSTVGLLGEDSKRISQIVTVIDEIARKTNLLALNAAIEAARAGDQGRGFAVVAGEVRRLAESTAQATGEIGTMIHEIQDRTRSAIASMASGTGTVERGVVVTTQAGEALERIIGMAERVDRMITQIAIAASQQATAADQSSASLDSIHTLSHENLTEMATTAAGIESLRGTAVTLENQVDRFSLMSLRQLRTA